MQFIQLVEFNTSNIDEMQALADEYDAKRAASGRVGAARLCADRDTPGRYIVVAEFEDHEAAMQNSEDPATQELAANMGKLSDGPASFRNLDVLRTWNA